MSKWTHYTESGGFVHATMTAGGAVPTTNFVSACCEEFGSGLLMTDCTVVDCPHCLSAIYIDGAQDKAAEQGYGVWKFGTLGDQYWIAAINHSEATAHMKSQPEGRGQITNIWRVPNIDVIDMVTGDPDGGEDPTPCSLRYLLRKELAQGSKMPMIIAASDWMG